MALDFPNSPTLNQTFVGQGGVLYIWDGAKWVASTSGLPGGPYAPLAALGVGRNRLHNSCFSINQRGNASGTALAAGAYGHDRWKAGSGGCTYTFTQSQPFTTITITAGSLQQIVEPMSVDGGTYTLSWTGTAQGRVNAGSYAASPVTVAGLAANTAITVEFNAGTLGRTQLEIGSVATPLDYGGSPQQQLAQCQRFYQVHTQVPYLYAAAGINLTYDCALPVQMRAAPTATYSNTTMTNTPGYSVYFQTTLHVTTQFTVTAAGVAGGTFTLALSADL